MTSRSITRMQQPAVNVLREVERFLSRNPAEVITIFVEDYVEAPKGLTRVLNASGLLPYMFPVWRMPKSGGDWPLLSDMVRDNHRLLVFTSKPAKEAAEGVAYEWRYVVENQCTYVIDYICTVTCQHAYVGADDQFVGPVARGGV